MLFVRKNADFFVTAAIFGSLPLFLPYTALATEALIFALMTVAFDLLLGYAGIMIFCQASFFGTAAYITGILIHHYQPNVFLTMGAALLGTGLLATIIGYLSTARKGTYCFLLTFAFNELIYFIADEWTTLTGGRDGLADMPRPNLEIPYLLDMPLTEMGFYYFALFFFILSLFLIRGITRSPLGKVLQGIRENESRMEAIGYKTRRFKVVAFVLGGVFMGMAGTLHAMFMNFVDISNASFAISAKVIMMEIVGGVGTLFGPILAAALITILSDLAANYWDRWPFILGAVFVAFVLFAQNGLWGIIENLKTRFALFDGRLGRNGHSTKNRPA